MEYIIIPKPGVLPADYPSKIFTAADYGTGIYSIDASAVEHGLTITANNVKTRIVGTDDDDYIIGTTAGGDALLGVNGYDTLWEGNGKDSINDGDANDRISGEAGKDTLYGGKGNDFLNGGAGADILVYKPNEGSDTNTDYNYSQGVENP